MQKFDSYLYKMEKLSTKDREKMEFLRKMVWDLSKFDKFRIVKTDKTERMWHV